MAVMQPAIAVLWVGILIFLLKLQSTEQSQELFIDDNDSYLDEVVDEDFDLDIDLESSGDNDNGGVSKKEEQVSTMKKDVNKNKRQLKIVMNMLRNQKQALRKTNQRIHSLINAPKMKERCIPYSLAACKAAVKKLGLSEGRIGMYSHAQDQPFTDTVIRLNQAVNGYPYKGCYYYTTGSFRGNAHYGTRQGTVSQLPASAPFLPDHPLHGPVSRPKGFDCKN